MAKAFKNGDFRSGYYRDQTFMMAAGLLTVQEFFAQLYAHTDVNAEPASAGRMMNGHYGTRSINEDGSWKDLKNLKNSSSDISPTAGQMLRLVGLAQASKYYRANAKAIGQNNFSNNGNEIAWGTIGNASSSEGHFFEAINAAGVLQIPMVVSVWDDAFGISVPAKYQTTKENISEIFALLHDYKMKVSLIQNSAISFSVCIDDKFGNFNELKTILSKKFKIAYNENVSLYTIRHFDEKAAQMVEQNKDVLLKQVSRETMQIITKENN